MRRRRTASAGFAAALTLFGVFEIWNHDTGVWPLAAGLLAPDAVPRSLRRAAHALPAPFVLGIAGFGMRRRGHQAQVAALGWSAHVFFGRALG
jgi:hypothetical protein